MDGPPVSLHNLGNNYTNWLQTPIPTILGHYICWTTIDGPPASLHQLGDRYTNWPQTHFYHNNTESLHLLNPHRWAPSLTTPPWEQLHQLTTDTLYHPNIRSLHLLSHHRKAHPHYTNWQPKCSITTILGHLLSNRRLAPRIHHFWDSYSTRHTLFS